MANEGDSRSDRVPEARVDVDGWNSLDPRWRDRVDTTSCLALIVEALRRIVELRDLLAEAGSRETSHALMLNGVLNALYELAVRERAADVALSVPYGTGASIVSALYEAGLLSRSEYRSIV